MTQFVSLTDHPVLHINTHASPQDLLMCAERRIRAVKNLMRSLSCVSVVNTDDHDLREVAEVAYLLLQESCDVLDVIQRTG